jgi:hypothetical protein
MNNNPFHVGQTVIFQPDARGLGQQVMAENLTPGAHYKIAEIAKGDYLVLEGVNSPGGGLHWSMFSNA